MNPDALFSNVPPKAVKPTDRLHVSQERLHDLKRGLFRRIRSQIARDWPQHSGPVRSDLAETEI
jgi:hypothetical protein